MALVTLIKISIHELIFARYLKSKVQLDIPPLAFCGGMYPGYEPTTYFMPVSTSLLKMSCPQPPTCRKKLPFRQEITDIYFRLFYSMSSTLNCPRHLQGKVDSWQGCSRVDHKQDSILFISTEHLSTVLCIY